MDASALLSSCELVALRSIAELDVGMDYWEDPTIRRYCALGLVFADGKRIRLTAEGTKVVATTGTMALRAFPAMSSGASNPASESRRQS